MSDILKTQYSEQFDQLRKNRIEVSYHKYGDARTNFMRGLVDARGCIDKCLKKFDETHNTEYLLDAANYCMFRYMFPQGSEYFTATDSGESAGIVGMSIKEMEEFTNESY